MTTINNIEDLLRIVRENEEFRAAMRRELLTDEILELPKNLALYVEATNLRLGKIEADIAELKTDVAELKIDVAGLKIDVDALRGDALENKIPTHLCQMLSDAFDIRRVQVIWMARGVVTPMRRADEFSVRIEEAADSGIITETEEGRLSRTDMVARSLRRADGTSLWIAAEASGVINNYDIDRARQ